VVAAGKWWAGPEGRGTAGRGGGREPEEEEEGRSRSSSPGGGWEEEEGEGGRALPLSHDRGGIWNPYKSSTSHYFTIVWTININM
jgi:hypothetical protein